MKNYRKKPLIIEAEQWFEVTYDKKATIDNPPIYHLDIRDFCHPDVSGTSLCKHCGMLMDNHGWIDTLEGGHKVCPGDWIIIGIKGEKYPCKSDIFKATYEEV